MFVRLSVLLLSLGLASCQTGPLIRFGANLVTQNLGTIFPYSSSDTDSNEDPNDQINEASPLVCNKGGESCTVMSQTEADKMNLRRTCDPADETDCWYYEKPKT